MKKLYVIATPIGNMNDISPNTIQALKDSEIIFCEDTRVTGKLLSKLKIINKKLVSYNNWNEKEKEDLIIELFNSKNSIGLVSDAGAPTVSDPGYFIVNKAIEKNVKVVPVSGASSIINFLMGSGASYDKFSFIGFLPKTENKILNLLLKVESREFLIFFESPHRIEKTLKLINNNFEKNYIVVGRELTKLNESFYYGSSLDILREIKLKGEIIVGFLGVENNHIYKKEEIISLVNEEIKGGLTKKDSIKKISEKINLGKNEVYNIYHGQ